MLKPFLKDDSLKACLFMALSGAFLIGGYELVRNPINSLFKSAYGMSTFTTALAFMPIAVFAVLFLYGKLLNRYSAEKTFLITASLSGGTIAIAYFLLQVGVKEMYIFLLIFREAYIVLLVEQLWSFINNTVDKFGARKVNGLVLGTATFGGIAADLFISNFAEKIGSLNLVIFSSFCFIPAMYFAMKAYKTTPKSSDEYKTKIINKKGGKGFISSLGLDLFKKEPILFVILFVIIASQTYATVVTLNFQSALYENIPQVDVQTAFSAKLFLYLHILSLAFQLILVPLLLTFVSLHHIHFLVPLINLVAILLAFFKPGLETASLAFILFKSIDYSLFRAAKEILYIPLSFDAKFRSKEVIDVLGYRLSKGFSASGLSAANKLGATITSASYSLLGVFSILAWLVFVLPLAKKQKD
jgi:AAA family ATP:ADP antiporter